MNHKIGDNLVCGSLTVFRLLLLILLGFDYFSYFCEIVKRLECKWTTTSFIASRSSSIVLKNAKLKKIYRMNIKQAKILLEKINRLFQSMTMDEHVSEIEKELMRNYVKLLYEEFLPESGAKPATLQTPQRVIKEVQKVKEVPRPVERIVQTPPPAPKVEVTPKPTPPPPPPKVEVVPEPTPPPAPKPVVVEKPKIVVKEEVRREPVRVEPVKKTTTPPPPPPSPKKPKISEEMEELFEFKKATDLSERLSESPLKDLRKAMGINERILTTNELFDGNGDALKDALGTLNNLNSFEDAKDYLANIGDIYDWTSRKKKKKAKVFVKLVRRRFL